MQSFGRYRILGKIASGGMADVFRAEAAGAAGFRKEVALKLVRGDFAGSAEHRDAFVREARLAARLSHANVVQVFEFGEAEGRHFIAMELVRGHDLGRVVARCREAGVRFGVARAVFVAAEVATALAHAHGAGGATGLVHRDVSPTNVLLSFEGEVKLADFGIARAASPAGLTRPGGLEGKVAYVAPEQARGEPADARADCFALGVVLWELLAGRRLFAREGEAATLQALLEGPPPSPPSAWNEEVPPALDALVLGCLERDPARRPGDARAVAAELRALLHVLARSPGEWEVRSLLWRLWPDGPGGESPAEGDGAPPPTLRAPVAAEPTADAVSTVALPRPRRRRAGALAVGLAALLALALALAVARRPEPRPATVAAPTTAIAPAVPASAAGAPGAAPSSGDASPAATAPPAPSAAPGPVAAPPSGPPYRFPLPPEASGEGIVVVHASPWGRLVVDGVHVGDTPREVRLPSGRHALRVEHPRLGAAESSIHVVAGRRGGWFPRLDGRR